MKIMSSPENTSIAGLLAYIAAREPNFARRIKGAAPEQIEELNSSVKKLSSFELPADYREFLAAMGGAETPFSFTYDATHVVSEVAEKHQILLEDGEKLPPASFLIAVYGFQIDEIALECAPENGGKISGGRVFVPDGERVGEVLGDRFVEYLYGQAFKYLVGAKTPVTATLTGARRAPSLALIEEIAARFGLEKQWFSDSVTLCACDAREKTVVYARQKAGELAWARVSGDERKTIVEVKESLEREADLNFEKWWN